MAMTTLRMGALLLLATAGVQADPANTCALQSNCFSFKFTKTSTGPSAACKTGACQWKVCMTMNMGGACVKNGDTFSHTCKKSGPDTICRDETNKNFTGITADQGIGSGYSQCQTGLPGSVLYFLLKDGTGCAASTPANYALPSLVSGSSLSCQPRPASIDSCTGNAEGQECVWSLTLPNCGTDSSSTTNSGDLTLSTQETTGTCAQQQQALGTMNKFTSGVGPSCPITSAQKVLADCCNCTQPSAGCQYLVCQNYVPPAKIQELQNLVNSGSCP